jgi:hypothetical protein
MLWSNAVLFAIVFLGFALPPLLPLDPNASRLTVGVAAVMLVAWAAFVRRFPCPRCGGNIGGMFGQRASGFIRSGRNEKAANNCPHCGVSLDAPWPH